MLPKFIEGVMQFQRDVFPEKRELFDKLSKGQSPEALFITCSDSRIEVGMLTQSNPGDLFVCRNAGNIVPPHTNHTGSVTASVEYAVAVLKVPNIVICGHTECGAMKGAMDIDSVSSLHHVKEWLSYSRAAVDVVKEIAGPAADEAERMRLLLEQNVILQLRHLKTHPAVTAAMAKGALTLHGWIYDIKTGEVLAMDEAQARFVPLREKYAHLVANDEVPAQSAAGGVKK